MFLKVGPLHVHARERVLGIQTRTDLRLLRWPWSVYRGVPVLSSLLARQLAFTFASVRVVDDAEEGHDRAGGGSSKNNAKC